jgi:hypothetical protein
MGGYFLGIGYHPLGVGEIVIGVMGQAGGFIHFGHECGHLAFYSVEINLLHD